MSSSFMLKGPISSDSRALPSGLIKFFPLREWLKRTVQPQWYPTDLLRERFASVRSTASRLPCKPSWAHFGKRDGAGRRWLLGIQQMLLLLLSSLFSLPQSLMRTSVYKCYHLSPSPPSWRREWRFYNYMCLRVSIKKALCINIKVIKVRTPKKILVSVQSLRKIF